MVAARKRRAWRTWAGLALEGGAGAAHAVARGAGPTASATAVHADGWSSASPRLCLLAVLAKWRGHWGIAPDACGHGEVIGNANGKLTCEASAPIDADEEDKRVPQDEL